MNNALLIQQVMENSAYTELMELTIVRHMNYCRAHKVDYEFRLGSVVKEWEQPNTGGWDKVVLILSALQRGYRYVIYLGVDTIIADLDADLRDGCPAEGGIGVVEHYCPDAALNVDVLYVTNSPAVQGFFTEWAGWWPGPANWHEQMVFIMFAQIPSMAHLVHKINPKYNSTLAGNCRVSNPVVEGFHGEGDVARRVLLMKRFMYGLQ